MGANQSSLGDPKAQESFYELLAVSRDATESELRKAYKKQALALHPDRNFQNEQEATTRFAKVQAAYETLIDPQERAWYDDHDTSSEYSVYSAKITKVEELRAYLEPNYVISLNVSKTELYRLISELFDRLRNEEVEAAFEAEIDKADVPVANAPSFGHTKTDWPNVKAFYDTWSAFSTVKSFKWEELYNTNHGEDRRTRRAMEARNKRIRDAAKREYNDTVRAVVRHIHSQDDRIKQQQRNQEIKRQEKKQQAELKKATSKPVVKEYQAPQWAQVDEDVSGMESDLGEKRTADGHYECVVCDLLFSSPDELAKHESSTKHVKALKKLQWQMRQEDERLNMDDTGSPATLKRDTSPGRSDEKSVGPDSDSEESDLVEQTSKLSVEDIMNQMDELKSGKSALRSSSQPRKKLGKAKQKRQQKKNPMAFALNCNVCNTQFDTKEELLEHAKKSRHAIPNF